MSKLLEKNNDNFLTDSHQLPGFVPHCTFIVTIIGIIA